MRFFSESNLELLRKKVDILTSQINEINFDVQGTLDELTEAMGQVNSMCKFLKQRLLFETVVRMFREEFEDDN